MGGYTGFNIWIKGMIAGAKLLALTGIDLFNDPGIIINAKEKFENRRGKDFVYRSVIGDHSPAVNYMKNKIVIPQEIILSKQARLNQS